MRHRRSRISVPANDLDQHDLGLAHDLRAMDRRRALTLLGGAGLVAGAAAVGACSSGSDVSQGGGASSTPTTAGSSSTTAAAAARSGGRGLGAASGSSASSNDTSGAIPQETAGPYPGDGSNGPNVLTKDGIVRQDIRSSFGTSSTTAEGVPLTVELHVVSVANGAAPLAGAAVYLWHCDQTGRYSLYSQGATQENYLRGVQAADADGDLTFTSIFPAAYQGRWPHIHFEVYPDVATATSAGTKLRTSQLALPEDVCNEVYATDGYEQSVRNMQRLSLESDMVFSDGWSLQLATVEGSTSDGLTASLTVPV
jgi:protocatechuate 3,4-dioxygenase beta subunit